MEPIISIFKLSTSFASACTKYLLIQKVDDLKNDINLIKGSFYQNALDFVQKASRCENDNNIRFFLESAYSNFSQSVLLYEGASDKFLDAASSVGIKESIADSVKLQGSNTVSRYYNNLVDSVKDKASSSDKENAKQYEKELDVLEMSYVGKAMCEYNMQEYMQCLNSIDKAIGAHMEPWPKMINNSRRMVKLASGLLSIGDIGLEMEYVYTRLLIPNIMDCLNYFTIQQMVSTKTGVSIDNMVNRNKIVRMLQNNPEVGDYGYLLHSIMNLKEIID